MLFYRRLASPARLEKDLPGTDSDSASDITHVSSTLLKNSPFLSGNNGTSQLGSLASISGTGSGFNGRVSSFKIGDRVLVNASSGTKLGTLMFLGKLNFHLKLFIFSLFSFNMVIHDLLFISCFII